jgi:hypothetical protein
MRLTSDGKLGIGTSSPSAKIHSVDSNGNVLRLQRDGAFTGSWDVDIGSITTGDFTIYDNENSQRAITVEKLTGFSGNSAVYIDSSGNLLVGGITTLPSSSVNGFGVLPTGIIVSSVANDKVTVFNRNSSDGEISLFQKGGTTVGSIATLSSQLYIGSSATSDAYLRFGNSVVRPCASDGANRDNAIDLGASGARFDDIYATNGTIQTSDRNEKQDIAELTDAEQRVAVAAKGLLRKFRWRDAVEAKGDDARTHFGIIAQDLQAAFAAEGLDAGDYAMFISSTWTDEETGEERTRMGVRYSELLAFIIGAL